jgi:hypothetical protein
MMNRVKSSLSIVLAGTFMIASLGLSIPVIASKAPSKRADNPILTWSTPDSNHQIYVYRVMDKNSSSYVSIHVDTMVRGKPGGSITLNGCSGENNLSLIPGETYECLVKYSAPLVVASSNTEEAAGFVQFIAKGPK